MKHTYSNYAGALLVPALMAGSAFAAQAPKQTPVNPAQTTPSEISRAADLDAGDTRERLNRLFEQYPPSLKQVLQLDPTLLANRDYLALYPTLNEFLLQHPEIAHNPSFFLGQISYRTSDPRQQVVEMWGNAAEAFAAFLAALSAILGFGWLVKTLIDYRRWQRLSKVQTEVHSKLLDRFTANEDLLAYIQTPAGRKFLESAPIPLDMGPHAISAPIGRILWSVQAGLVLAVGGLGLYYALPANLIDQWGAQPLSVISVLAIAVGAGFVISAGVSYVISQRLGLFGQASARPGGDTREAPNQP